MANKIIIGILVVLMILMGGSGYYSYTLTQQIDSLNNRLTISEMEQTARIDAVNDELTTFRAETLSSINALQGKITDTLSEIHTLKEELKEEIEKILETHKRCISQSSPLYA